VPGDGTHDCPAGYPIKGNLPSLLYHEPGQLSYNRTIPEVCFRTAGAAESAGFAPAHDDPGMRRGVARAAAAEASAVVLESSESDLEAEVLVGDAIVGDPVRSVSIEAAAFAIDDAPPGAVRGDGSRDCPPTYPIKASGRLRRYHMPGAASYESTTPEFCFSSVEAAERAGFSPNA
jgi:hypothetical protein